MNRAHLSADTPTVFETLDDADVRTAGTTYLMYRGRHRHEPPARQRAHARRRDADAPPGDGPARAVLRRHLRLAADRLPLGARHARACATATPAAFGATWSSTTCSTSCCCRCPTTTGTRTSAAPRASCSRSPRPTCSSRASLNAAGGLDAFLDEHAVIVMADHSQAPVDDDDRAAGRARRAGRARPRPAGAGSRAARAPRRSSRASPSAPPSARRWSMRCTSAERDAMRASVVALRAGDRRAWSS